MSPSLRHRHTPASIAVLLLVCLLGLALSPARAADIRVAVASNFAPALQELGEIFEAESGHRLRISPGSSGRLYAQIVNGAPFHVFLSADQEKPRQLEDDGLVAADSRFTYAIGRLVLWSSRAKLLDAAGSAVLAGREYNRLALANPRLAPYGRAARETLASLDLLEHSRPYWVEGENIAQTFQFVATGNADLGFVALSQLHDHGEQGSAWLVPGTLHEPIRQDAVLLATAADNNAARAFLDYLRSAGARERIAARGYRLQAADGER